MSRLDRAMESLEASAAALKRLQVRMLGWTPEERAFHNKRLLEQLKPVADHLRFSQKAQEIWDAWLETTRPGDKGGHRDQ